MKQKFLLLAVIYLSIIISSCKINQENIYSGNALKKSRHIFKDSTETIIAPSGITSLKRNTIVKSTKISQTSKKDSLVAVYRISVIDTIKDAPGGKKIKRPRIKPAAGGRAAWDECRECE